MTETQASPAYGDGLAVGASPEGPIDLNRLALGDLTPAQAGPLIADLLEGASPAQCGPVYDALCALAWKQSAERTAGERLREWYDLDRYASGLMIEAGATELGTKLLGVCDLVLRWLQFGTTRPAAAIRQRAHELPILQTIEKRGGLAWRKDIMTEHTLKEGNASRILANLASDGFIERTFYGQRMQVSLTARGRETLKTRMRANLVAEPPLQTGA